MSRYIDAEELKATITANAWSNPAVPVVVNKIIDVMPAADVVEVVRCKDCKHFGKDMGYGKHDCKKYEMPYCLENDYCSYGERKK